MSGVWVTKILRPGAPRVGQIGRVQLARTIPLPSLLAGGGGLLAGLLLFGVPLMLLGIDTVAALGFGAALGCGIGLIAVSWSPWREESLLRFTVVKLRAQQGVTTILCPGVDEEPGTDLDTGDTACPSCFKVLKPDERGLIPPHRWRLRVYLGMMELGNPDIGESIWISGTERAYPSTGQD